MPIEPIEIKCGELVTNASKEDVGLKNYSVKRDFRRIAPDRDARREGFAPFQPNSNHPTTPSNLPSTSGYPTLRKIAQVRAGNGKVAVIVANADSLFRYFSLEVGDYYAGDGTANAYFAETGLNTPYYQEVFNDWVQIGSGFSALATYWEAVQVNNTLVLNNGVDLPVTFNVLQQTVTPMYELRDQGVASVGTIWEFNGILMLGNVVEINNNIPLGQLVSPFTTLMSSASAYSRFSAVDPGASGYTSQQINAATNQFQYRVIWSMPGEPSRFAAAVPCSTTFGSNHIILQWPSKSFQNGQQILVNGAGVNGGNITATVLWINPANGADLYLDTTMLATVQGTYVQALDSVGSMVGYEDLDDDGSAIVRGEKIRTSCVIYKDTSIFLCNFTGATGAPFSFQRVYNSEDGSPTNSIYYRNTLVSVVHDWQSWHFYCGRNGFFKFDLISLTPTPIFKEIENLFFGNEANLLANPGLVFAANNSITNEIFLNNPGNGSDTVICIDYKYNTTSTSSMQITCASQVQYPTATIPLQGTNVFLMGDQNNLGALIQYGLMNDGSAPIFSRCVGLTTGQPYASVLASGLSAIGSRMNDTLITGYELRVNNLTGRVTMMLLGENNPNRVTTFFSVDRTAASGVPSLFIPCAFVGQTFADTITVMDANVQCEVDARIFSAIELPTMGAGRN